MVVKSIGYLNISTVAAADNYGKEEIKKNISLNEQITFIYNAWFLQAPIRSQITLLNPRFRQIHVERQISLVIDGRGRSQNKYLYY